MEDNTFKQKFQSAFANPKVIVVMLGMIASSTGWGVSLLMDFGSLKATAEMTQTQVQELKQNIQVLNDLHASEMENMRNLLNKVIGSCTGVE